MVIIRSFRPVLRVVTCLALSAIVGFVLCGKVSAQSEDSESSDHPFKPRKLMSPRKAIVDAPFLAADKVAGQVSDSELVIGVVIEGHARAYPINMLTGPAREIINDRIGKTNFAATW